MKRLIVAIALLFPLSSHAQETVEAETIAKPAAIVADGIPDIPQELAEATRPYFEYRKASFAAWNPQTSGMFITTRFADTAQLHQVDTPGAARSQLTFEAEPIGGVLVSPGAGDVSLVLKDNSGDEFDQIYRLQDGLLQLLTDGSSKNGRIAWTPDGSMIAYASTKRNGRDFDLYIMDPRVSGSSRLLAEREGGGWAVLGFTPDGKMALAANYISVTNIELHHINVATGAVQRLTREGAPISHAQTMEYAPDGRLWVATDDSSDFKRIGVFNTADGSFEPVIEEPWDIESFDISDDGRMIAYEVNAAGQSQLKLYDITTGTTREVALPPGVLSGVEIAPWGQIGLTIISNQAAADAYSVDPVTLELTRWTTSEMGGRKAADNVRPELFEIESFDGERMSGFLYLPDSEHFPGPRPLLINIHGGPEVQSTATFLGRNNYLINELGIAIFYPNVRGSSGFGKRFVSLDNGPFLRENSVRDIGAFLDRLGADPRLADERFGVTGGSYGGTCATPLPSPMVTS